MAVTLRRHCKTLLREQPQPLLRRSFGYSPGGLAADTDPNSLAQPSQVYPSQYGSGQVQRQDTASQPWYGGARPIDASSTLVDPNFIMNTQYLQGAAGMVSSLTSIWDDLNLGSLWKDDGSYFEEDSSSDVNWDWSNWT